MENNILTIFTPTYNRAYILPKLFESLISQTCKSFRWLIIDDGSTDDTKKLAENYCSTADFKIQYIYKENGGKHTAINLMLDIVDTDLVLIADSDDFLDKTAVETIIGDYHSIANSGELCTITYLRAYFSGEIIGDEFHEDRRVVHAIDDIINGHISGDKCEVFFTKALKNYRFPVFTGEKFIGETVVWIPLYRQYKTLLRNKAIYYCEYREDGLSAAGRKMRIQNPKGGMENSLVYISPDIKLQLRIKNTLLYITYGFFDHKSIRDLMQRHPYKLMLVSMLFPGACLYLFWKIKYGD